MLIHATTVAIDGLGVIIRGAPGVGKSDLALRLIDAPGYGTGGELLRTRLVSDDQTRLELSAGKLIASPGGGAIAGKLEVRGQGIVDVDHEPSCETALIVELSAAGSIERLPDPQYTELLGVKLPLIQVDPAKPSAPARVRSALSSLRSVRAPAQ